MKLPNISDFSFGGNDATNAQKIAWSAVAASAVAASAVAASAVVAVVTHNRVKPQAIFQLVNNGAAKAQKGGILQKVKGVWGQFLLRMAKPYDNLSDAKNNIREAQRLISQSDKKPPTDVKEALKIAQNHPSDPSGKGKLSASEDALAAVMKWLGL